MKNSINNIKKVISKTPLDSNGTRTRLAAIKGSSRLTFIGTYTRCGYKTENSDGEFIYYEPIDYSPTLLLDNITCCGEEVTDHIWLTYSRKFRKLGELHNGDKVSFTATVGTYEKGYYTNRTKDYQLSGINDVTLLTHNPNRYPLPLRSDTMVGYTMANNVDFYLSNNRPYVQDFVTDYDHWAQKHTPDRMEGIARAEYEADNYNSSYINAYVDNDSDEHPNKTQENDERHSKLVKLGIKKRYTFVGRYSDISYSSFKHHHTPQLEISNIKFRNQKVSDGLWFNYTKSFKKLGELHDGDLVQFNARVIKSVSHPGLASETHYYKLGYPTKAHLISKTDQDPRMPFPLDDNNVIVGYAMSIHGIDSDPWEDNPNASDYFCLDDWKEWKLDYQLENMRSHDEEARQLAKTILKFKMFKRHFSIDNTNLSTDYDDSNILGMLKSDPNLASRLFVTTYNDNVFDLRHYKVMTWQLLRKRVTKYLNNGSLHYHIYNPSKHLKHLSFCRDVNITGMRDHLLTPLVHYNFAIYFNLLQNQEDHNSPASKLSSRFFKEYQLLTVNPNQPHFKDSYYGEAKINPLWKKIRRLYSVLGIRLIRDTRSNYSKIYLSKQSLRNLRKMLVSINDELNLTPQQRINDIRKAAKYIDLPKIKED